MDATWPVHAIVCPGGGCVAIDIELKRQQHEKSAGIIRPRWELKPDGTVIIW
jgi:hypothetical protein